jgi:hypothetical protein
MKKLLLAVSFLCLIATAAVFFNVSNWDTSAFGQTETTAEPDQGTNNSVTDFSIEAAPEQQAIDKARAILDNEPNDCCHPEQQAVDKARAILDKEPSDCCHPEQQAVDKARAILDKMSGR